MPDAPSKSPISAYLALPLHVEGSKGPGVLVENSRYTVLLFL